MFASFFTYRISTVRYTLCGLTVDSELPLPELLTTESASDVTVRLGRIKHSRSPEETSYIPVSPSQIYVFYAGLGVAIVSDGRDILLDPAPSADPVALRLFLLQQVFCVILIQRGYFVLHCSAALVNGNALAFSAASGRGKSTMTAALNQLGHQVMTDDMLAVDFSGNRLMALPGLHQLKLTESARAQVAPTIIAEQTIGDGMAKKLCAIRGEVSETAAPLEAIYLLGAGERIEFQRVPPTEAAIALVPLTYGARLMKAIGLAEKHFQMCARLAKDVRIERLLRPRDLSLVPKIAQNIVERLNQPISQ